MEKSSIVGFDPRPLAAEFLCPKSLANVSHYDHTMRLKQIYDTADPAENRACRIAVN